MKEALAPGQSIMVFQPGPFAQPPTSYDGVVFLEGPHYPQPHKWWAKVLVERGVIKEVL